MNPNVLIISSKYDFSSDLVCRLLVRDKIPFIRINREELIDYRITLDPLKPELVISYSNNLYTVDPDHLFSVWYRQPVFLRNTPSAALSPKQQLVRSQWIAFLRGLSLFTNARWMNWPQATYLAESKPYQLNTAKEIGFNIPKTNIGNDLNRIKKSKIGNPVILKSLDTVLLFDNGDSLFTYSTICDYETWTEEEVADAPILIQEVISNKTDIRVTIIGEDVFAVRILENGKGIQGDWRLKSKDLLQFQDHKLDKEIISKCKKLTKKLGLSFSAIDLLGTENEIYFLEINPTGEWGWLSNDLRPIDGSIANWLCER